MTVFALILNNLIEGHVICVPMKLGPTPKRYTEDNHRAVPPWKTLERVGPLADRIGLEELEDITDLDRLKIPVFSCIRSSTVEGAACVHNGKGASKEQAKTSAIMEALERYSGEMRDPQVEPDFVQQMMSSQNCVDPRTLILPEMTAFHLMHHRIGWVKGYELFEEEEIWVPANAVFHPYNSSHLRLFRSNSNGLASGNTIEEAVLHGLCELIERDAWSISEFRGGVNGKLVDETDNKIISDLIERFKSNGVEIHMSDITSDIGIPTVAAAGDDTVSKDPAMLTIGVGTHLNPEIAAIRALTEVAQSRATHLYRQQKFDQSGPRIGYEKVKEMNKMWFSSSVDELGLTDLPSYDSMDIYEDVQTVLDKMRKAGIEKAVVVDLTDEELGVPVVRTIVPWLEVYTMDPQRMGPRLRGDTPSVTGHF